MTAALQTIDMSLPIGSLDAYIQRVNSLPMLSLEEEQELAKRYREHNDIEAARRMVMAHLRFVVRVARGYKGYGLPIGDLIQEGNIGLMKAVKRFDPSLGVRLVSFAVHWVKAEIHEFVIRNWRVVKVATTKAQRKLFFNLRNFKKRLGWFTKAEVEGVARDLGVSTEEVLRMEARLNAHDVAYDTPKTDDDSDATSFTPAHYLEDKTADPAHIAEVDNTKDHNHQALEQAMQILDQRSQDILQSRWLVDKKATLHELAAKYSVSAERIRQLEQNAMKKLREAMNAA